MPDIDPDGTVHTAPAINTEPFTPTDDVEVTMDTFKGGIDNPRGFIVDVTGTLSIKNLNDSITTSIPVLAGVPYPIAAKEYRSTGTTGVTRVIGLA